MGEGEGEGDLRDYFSASGREGEQVRVTRQKPG